MSRKALSRITLLLLIGCMFGATAIDAATIKETKKALAAARKDHNTGMKDAEKVLEFTDDLEHWAKNVSTRETRLSSAHLEETFEVQKIRQTLANIRPNFEFVDQPLRDDAGKLRRSALREARLKTETA